MCRTYSVAPSNVILIHAVAKILRYSTYAQYIQLIAEICLEMFNPLFLCRQFAQIRRPDHNEMHGCLSGDREEYESAWTETLQCFQMYSFRPNADAYFLIIDKQTNCFDSLHMA